MTSNEDTVKSIVLLNDIILHDDDLSDEAKSQFSFHKDILHAYNLDRLRIIQNHKLTPVGRHLLLFLLDSNHKNCNKVLNYAAANKEVLQKNMPNRGPLIICGLPRTGSTLLYNLLACDPNSRALLFREVYPECVPPISRTNVEEQTRKIDALRAFMYYREQLLGRPRKYAEIHPVHDIEEDMLILMQGGLNMLVKTLSPIHQIEMDHWFYDDTNKDFAYDYHKIFLRMLDFVDSPRSHWLLKAPMHSLFLGTLNRHYPNALLIMTHRHLNEVLPSICSLTLGYGSDYYDVSDPENRITLETQAIQSTEHMIDCIVKFRRSDRHAEERSHKIFDVNYENLMRQPIVIVREIYQHFGLNWSDEFETNMQNWLRENPQGKQGRHTYNLSQFNLTAEDIAMRYADYINMFLASATESEHVAEKAIYNTLQNNN
ncbi:unnamed protein product [Rotaria sp. Silwood2]|nr:unnamed protein product [Rotaria sp. Silwood2]CAF3077331.1 unnamed protein product [Rotaria sp. Silwood2]CAF3905757.1 unnamed protein product [Rotaria sp. Silwood2]CAF4155165.1 unnamed protein product [Rotaria sp. Silwood2]